MYKVTLIPGDGTGPEITEVAQRVFEATGVAFEWDIQNAGEDVYNAEGTPLPDRVLESIKKNKVAIKGPITTPVGTGFRSVNVTLRQTLDLYSGVRPCKSDKGAKTR
jgi:isocitrate dehydrogenase (NAD+)